MKVARSWHILLGSSILLQSLVAPTFGAEQLIDFEKGVDLQQFSRSSYTCNGIEILETANALVDSDDGGTGSFGGEPSSKTVLTNFVPAGDYIVQPEISIEVPGGFQNSFSFFY